MSTISNFSSKFRGGVRPNLFNCSITPPTGVMLSNDFSFHCKGTSMPASSVPAIDVNYLGRQLKVPGDRTYADWTVTVYNDVDMSIRHAFEGWMHKIQNHGVNYQEITNPYGTATVTQLSRGSRGQKGDGVVASYIMEVMPTEVSAIDLAWDSNDAVEEYTVNFAVNTWVTDDIGAPKASGDDSIKWHIEGNRNGITGGSVAANFGKFRASAQGKVV